MMFNGAVVSTAVDPLIIEPAVDVSAPVEAAEGAMAEEAPRKELVFIDAAVKAPDVLLGAIKGSPEIITLEAGADGIKQIEQALAGRGELDAIHIISHGGDGRLFLGDAIVDACNIFDYTQALSAIGALLAHDGDILLYGHNLGQSADGRAFTEDLSALTGADVAASDDRTAAALGGDVELEIATGAINTAAVLGHKRV